jgi:hypothetical protein
VLGGVLSCMVIFVQPRCALSSYAAVHFVRTRSRARVEKVCRVWAGLGLGWVGLGIRPSLYPSTHLTNYLH